MTVKELIEKLKEFPEDYIVECWWSDEQLIIESIEKGSSPKIDNDGFIIGEVDDGTIQIDLL